MNTIYDLYLRIMMQKIDQQAAKQELETYVRQADQALGVDLLQAAEACADYKTYEQLRQAACLVREAMNTLYTQTKD